MIDVVRILRETFVARAEHHPTLGSTNDRAAQCAAQGVKELPLLIVVDEQTAGRGRGANRWWTGRGALAMSLLLDAETVAIERNCSPLVALAAAVAVADAVAPLLPNHTVGLNWPNDVMACEKKVTGTVCRNGPEGASHKRCLSPFSRMADSRKLAGILIEVLADRRHVIGIGLNANNTLADAPAELQSTAGTIRDLSGKTHDQTDILVDLLKRLEQAFSKLRQEPANIAARADALCLQRGRTLALQLGDRRATGRCRGIAPDGALLLETSVDVEAFYSGCVTDSI